MRRLAGWFTMVLLAMVVLAACGDDDDEGSDDATEEATETVVATEVEETEEAATEAATEDVDAVVAGGAATAEDELAAEGAEIGVDEEGTPIPAGTPIVAATPGGMATPAAEASPVADAVASPAAATPIAEFRAQDGAETLSMQGEVVLPGAMNETYVVSDNGCVGLGEYSDMQAGRQLVVRDETGTIIGVTTIEASDSEDTCTWNFTIDVPQSDFYAVSIPMEFERVFTNSEIQDSAGQVSVPLR